MKFIKILPYECVLDDDQSEIALWKSNHNVCEYQKENELCDTSGIYYGTSQGNEPKFCARHFYQIVASGDGKTNYKLANRQETK